MAQARQLIEEIRRCVENETHPAALVQAVEAAQKFNGVLTAQTKHLAENNGLLQSLLNSLEQLQKLLDAEAKAQAEQRVLEKETLAAINEYLKRWQ